MELSVCIPLPRFEILEAHLTKYLGPNECQELLKGLMFWDLHQGELTPRPTISVSRFCPVNPSEDLKDDKGSKPKKRRLSTGPSNSVGAQSKKRKPDKQQAANGQTSNISTPPPVITAPSTLKQIYYASKQQPALLHRNMDLIPWGQQ